MCGQGRDQGEDSLTSTTSNRGFDVLCHYSLNIKSKISLAIICSKLLAYNKFIYDGKINVPGNTSTPKKEKCQQKNSKELNSHQPFHTQLRRPGCAVWASPPTYTWGFLINIWENFSEICNSEKTHQQTREPTRPHNHILKQMRKRNVMNA